MANRYNLRKRVPQQAVSQPEILVVKAKAKPKTPKKMVKKTPLDRNKIKDR